ncbi:MAG: hypothetical protein J6B11_01015 [Spirochaetales bacterium]|nr:hypothetical protein [Spirochaetales bacterium]
MKEAVNLDDAYLIYEERYNLTKLAEESGLDMEKFQAFSSKEKFFTLAYKLKDTEHFHLASFFFNKLFEILQSMEALLNKIDCLIILGEFEEAFRFNCLGFELFLELSEETPLIDDIEKTLSYQKAIILFSSSRYMECISICEDNIIKFGQKTFFPLLCASLIGNKKFENAVKLFKRFQNDKPYTFLAEVTILLLSINQASLCIDFLSVISGKNIQKDTELSLINLYKTSKSKLALENFLKSEIENFNIADMQVFSDNRNSFKQTIINESVVTVQKIVNSSNIQIM